jgi:hypothetical protein
VTRGLPCPTSTTARSTRTHRACRNCRRLSRKLRMTTDVGLFLEPWLRHMQTDSCRGIALSGLMPTPLAGLYAWRRCAFLRPNVRRSFSHRVPPAARSRLNAGVQPYAGADASSSVFADGKTFAAPMIDRSENPYPHRSFEPDRDSMRRRFQSPRCCQSGRLARRRWKLSRRARSPERLFSVSL